MKVRVLGVRSGIDPCSYECAESLATGVRSLLGADIAVATTGVGGPDAEGLHAPGTVYLGWATSDASGAEYRELGGSPEQVLDGTVDAALRLLVRLAGEDPGGTRQSASSVNEA